jgi:hypothetical protein
MTGNGRESAAGSLDLAASPEHVLHFLFSSLNEANLAAVHMSRSWLLLSVEGGVRHCIPRQVNEWTRVACVGMTGARTIEVPLRAR